MSDNKVGSACWYKQGYTNYSEPENKWYGGKLLGWSIDSDISQEYCAHFPVGLILDDKTGQVHSIYAGFINFNSTPGGPIA